MVNRFPDHGPPPPKKGTKRKEKKEMQERKGVKDDSELEQHIAKLTDLFPLFSFGMFPVQHVVCLFEKKQTRETHGQMEKYPPAGRKEKSGGLVIASTRAAFIGLFFRLLSSFLEGPFKTRSGAVFYSLPLLVTHEERSLAGRQRRRSIEGEGL